MKGKRIKKYGALFTRHFPTTLPPMGWYFSTSKPLNRIQFPSDEWTCMFSFINDVALGKALRFSKDNTGCSGASCYLGFKGPHVDAGRLLAKNEKFKEKTAYGNAFYTQIKARQAKRPYLVLSRIEDIADDTNVEVVNYWITPLSLAGLVTLSNFDRPTNNNVAIPFASGCQGMWTIPYKETNK